MVICEIGCGNGRNLLKLRSSGFQVYGVEPDRNARKIASNLIDNIYDGTAEKLPQDIFKNCCYTFIGFVAKNLKQFLNIIESK